MRGPEFIEQLTTIAEQADTVFAQVRAAFHESSPSDRAKMLDVLSEFELKHQSHLAQFARAVDTAPSVLSTAAKDLHYRSTAELLQCEFGVTKGQADMTVRQGKLLEKAEYPTLTAAMEAGTVSTHQANVAIRLLDEWRGSVTDEFLMRAEAAATDWARGNDLHEAMKPEQLQKLLRNWHKKEHPDQAQATAEWQHEQRRASAFVRRDGMINFCAVLTPWEGAAIMQYLEASSSPRAGARVGEADSDFRTGQQKMADATVRAFTVAAKAKDAPTQAGAAPTLLLTGTIEEIRKYAASEPALATVSRTGEMVPIEQITRIVCEGAVQAAITDQHGKILKLGRSTRLFSAAQRRALNVEYPGCATSGCDIPAAWCESHHIKWWSRGGLTDASNGVNLCNYHHHQVHMGHFELQQDTKTHRWKAVRVIRR